LKYLQNYKTKCVVSLAIQQSYYNKKQRIHAVISQDLLDTYPIWKFGKDDGRNWPNCEL